MNATLLQAWENTLRRNRDKRAVVEAAAGNSVTFAELDALALRWLEHHGRQSSLHGATVVFAAPNGVGWLTIFLALVRGGAVIVPLDTAEPPAAQRKLATGL